MRGMKANSFALWSLDHEKRALCLLTLLGYSQNRCRDGGKSPYHEAPNKFDIWFEGYSLVSHQSAVFFYYMINVHKR